MEKVVLFSDSVVPRKEFLSIVRVNKVVTSDVFPDFSGVCGGDV